MRQHYNFLDGYLTAGITVDDTTIHVDNTNLPYLDPGDYFDIVLSKNNAQSEIATVVATDPSAQTMTVIRGQEGTIARIFLAGTGWGNVPIASDFNLFGATPDTSAVFSVDGLTGDVDLPHDGAANVPSLRTLGSGEFQAVSGTDSRLSNSRTPTTDSVTTIKILDGNVTLAKLATDSVSTIKILDNAVTTAKILNANVTSAKLATDSVTTSKILDSNVTTAKIVDNGITTAKILNANVTGPKIADGAITGDKILDATITADKLDSSIASPVLTSTPVGSVTVPSLAFTGDSNTGFYHPVTADTLAVTVGGVNVSTFSGTSILNTVPVTLTSGGSAGVGTQTLASNLFVQSLAGNVVVNGTGLLGNNYNFSTFTYSGTDTHSGGGSFLVNAATATRFSDELIPIRPERFYRLDLWAKSGDIAGTNYNASNAQYVGLAPVDADGLVITPAHASKFPGSTDTTLAVTLSPGANSIVLTDATGWSTNAAASSRNMIWYGYVNAKLYTYPNYTYSRLNSDAYSSNDTLGAWGTSGISGNTITLRVPWAGPSIPATTAVRNHNAVTTANTYKYILSNTAIPSTWTNYSDYFGGIDTTGLQDAHQFPYGTAFVKFAAVVNTHGAANNNVRFSDISLSEISARNLEVASSSSPGVVSPTVSLFVPTLSVTGKNSLSPRTFTGRKATTGAPTTSAWLINDEVMDSDGTIWRCTASGTPGTWVQAGSISGAVVGSATPIASAVTAVVGVAAASSREDHVHPSTGLELLTRKDAALGYPGLDASGRILTTALGTGTASSGTYLRGDRTWVTIASAPTAASVSFSPEGSIESTTVQDAIEEVRNEAASGSVLVGSSKAGIPPQGCIWGAKVGKKSTDATTDERTRIATLEAQFSSFTGHRFYTTPTENFVITATNDQLLLDDAINNRTSYISFRPPFVNQTSDPKRTWANMATNPILSGGGHTEGILTELAIALGAYSHPIVVMVDHEPDADANNRGTGTEYGAWCQAFFTEIREHAPRVTTAVNFAGYKLFIGTMNTATARTYLPTDLGLLDMIACNPYLTKKSPDATGLTGFTFKDQVLPWIAFANTYGKPLGIFECGATLYSTVREAWWTNSVYGVIPFTKANPVIKTLLAWHDTTTPYDSLHDFYIDDTTTLKNVIKPLVADPYFHPQATGGSVASVDYGSGAMTGSIVIPSDPAVVATPALHTLGVGATQAASGTLGYTALGQLSVLNGISGLRDNLPPGTHGQVLCAQPTGGYGMGWVAPAINKKVDIVTTYTAILGDANYCIEMNNSSAGSFIVPANSTVAYPIGTGIEVMQYSTTAFTVSGAGGVTFKVPADEGLVSPGQYYSIFLRKRDTNDWVATGGTT